MWIAARTLGGGEGKGLNFGVATTEVRQGLYYMRQGSVLVLGEIEYAFDHAPPLQEFGDTLTRSMRNSINQTEKEQTRS